MKGRKRKPTALRLLAGNPGKRPLNDAEPEPEPGIPAAPAHLSEKTKAVWDDTATTLDEVGVLTKADGLALEQLCENHVEILALRETIEREGRFQKIVTKTGDTRITHHPAWTQLSDAEKRFRAMLEQFGLTPAGRTRVKANPITRTPFDAFRKKKTGAGRFLA